MTTYQEFGIRGMKQQKRIRVIWRQWVLGHWTRVSESVLQATTGIHGLAGTDMWQGWGGTGGPSYKEQAWVRQ